MTDEIPKELKEALSNLVPRTPVESIKLPKITTVRFRINGSADREKLIGILGMYGYKTWASAQEVPYRNDIYTHDYYVNVEIPD